MMQASSALTMVWQPEKGHAKSGTSTHSMLASAAWPMSMLICALSTTQNALLQVSISKALGHQVAFPQ